MSFSYARGEIRSFVATASRPYIHRMEKSGLKFDNYPSPEELYAFERAARAARAAEVMRLLRAAFSAVRHGLARTDNEGLRHA
jgi:hypothetical protein